jgi:hypothetical protein
MPGEGGRKGRATGRQTQALPRQPRSPLPNGSRLTSPVRCSGRADPGIDPERHRNRRLDVWTSRSKIDVAVSGQVPDKAPATAGIRAVRECAGAGPITDSRPSLSRLGH